MGLMGPMRPMGLMGLMGLMRPIGPMGLIKPIKPRGPMAALLLAVANSTLFTLHSTLLLATLLLACSSDDESVEAPQERLIGTIAEEQQEQMMAVEAFASAPDYVPAAEARGESREAKGNDYGYWGAGTAKRTWAPPTIPTEYFLYDELYTGIYTNYESLTNRTIDAFLTHTGALTTPNELHCRLRYMPAEPPAVSKWKLALPNLTLPGGEKLTEDNVDAGDYYIYGFIPRDAADDATISKVDEDPATTYAKGAVLTIQGMKSAMSDVCVVIGAKEGPDADHDAGLTAGDFKFNLKKGESVNNYMYLLFDHLCSALNISMSVYGDYNELRTIKLKEIRLQTANDGGKTKAKMNVTVTLKANGSGSNPIESIVYTPTGEEEVDAIVYYNEAGHKLTTEYSLFLCHFIPHGVKELILTCTYDVYDKKNNLIRANCSATNKIVLSSLISYLDEVRRGYKYTINMTIRPTYLYMLSEPDLDNPTVRVE